MTALANPDASAAGVLGHTPDPLRYGESDASDPAEAAGMMRSLMPSNARVLDVGCGAGGVTLAINGGKNNTVMGVEPDPERAALARSRGLNVVCGFFDESFCESCGKFDAILFGDVLEHLVDPARVLTLARRCLSEGGVIIISVPNVAHWTVRLRLLLGKFDYRDSGIMDATHLRWFTRKTLLTMLDHTGFAVSDVRAGAGLWMGEYRRKPFSFLPQRIRRGLVLVLVRAFPTFMACQHVVAAKVGEPGSRSAVAA